METQKIDNLNSKKKSPKKFSIVTGYFIYFTVLIIAEYVPVLYGMYYGDGRQIASLIYCFILFAPFVFASMSNNLKKIFNPDEEIVWRTVSYDKFKGFIENNIKCNSLFFRIVYKFYNSAIVIVIAFFSISIAVKYSQSNQFAMAATVMNLAFVPVLLVNCLASPEPPNEALKFYAASVEVLISKFDKIALPYSLQMGLGVYDGKPFVKDNIRIMIDYPDKPDTWLCSMISFTKTKVKSEQYPYVYFVLVIKGPKAVHNTRLLGYINDAISYSYKGLWNLEAKVQDDNSVFVITKGKLAIRSYYTSPEEVEMLPVIADRIYKLVCLDSNRVEDDTIELNLTK